jgi:hypothetical protein
MPGCYALHIDRSPLASLDRPSMASLGVLSISTTGRRKITTVTSPALVALNREPR